MPRVSSPRHSSPFQLLVHLMMTPAASGTFSWQLAPDQLTRLAEDLRWLVLRRIFPELDGRSPYKALLQKHSIRIDSLDIAFFRDILTVVKEQYRDSFGLAEARELSDCECLNLFFIPVILEWAATEKSVSVSRERTPSFEDLITHEDFSGNVYQRFPDEFLWTLSADTPGKDPEPETEIPAEMRQFVLRIAKELSDSLESYIRNGRLEKYILLMSRLEDDICTWEMTFDYLNSLGGKKYSNWKSLSVVANRAMKEYVSKLPEEVKEALGQNNNEIPKEEKQNRLRIAVSAALELYPLPTPRELIA